MHALKLSAVIGFTSLMSLSCSDAGPPSRAADKPSGDAQATPGTCLALTAATSWQGGIDTIFQTNCGSCHPGVMPSNYTMFYDVTTNINAIMMRIDAGTMPTKGPLASADKAAIKAWITAGMPEVDGPPAAGGTTASTGAPGTTPASCPSTTASTPPSSTTPPPPVAGPNPPIVVAPLEPTYAKGVQPIMAAYCVGCHSAAGGTGPYLDSLNSVKSNYSNVLAQITSGGMPVPRSSTSKLPQDKIDIVTQWGSNPNAPYGRFAP